MAARKRYLFPVQVLGKLFRGKLLDGLRRAHRDGKLLLDGTPYADPAAFARTLDQLYHTDWVVYSKAPFAGPEHVYRGLVDCEVVHVEGNLAATLAKVRDLALSRCDAREPVALSTCDILPTAEEVLLGPATPIDDNPHSIPVYGTQNPRQKAYPET